MRPASRTCRVLMKPCPSSPRSADAESVTVLEHDLARVARPHPQLVFFLSRRHAGGAVREHERGDAAVPLRAIGDGDHDHHAADLSVRDEALRPVQHPAVATSHRRRPHRRRHRFRRPLRSIPRRPALRRRRAAAETPSSALRCRTSKCAPCTGRCARRPRARSRDRHAPSSSMQMQ